MIIALVVVHATLAAVWLGSMAYSLLVVQPKAARFFRQDEEAHEAFLTTLATGNRWPVVAVIAGLAASGAALWALSPPTDALGTAVHAVKATVLIAAAVVFWYVSWRLWPRRVFALPAERPRHRAVLRRAAVVLIVLVGCAFVLGLAAPRLS